MTSDTRARLLALRMVRNGEVRWRAAERPRKLVRLMPSGFARADGQLTLSMLIALWELKYDYLICVDDGRVLLTVSGVDCLKAAT